MSFLIHRQVPCTCISRLHFKFFVFQLFCLLCLSAQVHCAHKRQSTPPGGGGFLSLCVCVRSLFGILKIPKSISIGSTEARRDKG